MHGTTIKARRLDETGFSHEVEIIKLKTSWDIWLMRIKGVGDCHCGELAMDGSLDVGEIIFHFGHADEFVGSFLMGSVAYRCSDDVVLSTSRSMICQHYDPEALENTPLYRVMGNVWHSGMFKPQEHHRNEKKQDPYKFEKNLDPLLPIIQCNGLTCGVGCSGGPVFNINSKIVGMLVSESGGCQIAVHVTALRDLINTELVETGTQLSIDLGGSTKGGDVSKKRGCFKERGWCFEE